MQRIAATLGITVEAFHAEGELARKVEQTDEMFRLWSTLRSLAARDGLLECARTAVEAERTAPD